MVSGYITLFLCKILTSRSCFSFDLFSEHIYRNPLAGFPLLIGVSKKSFLGYILAAGPHGRQTQANDRCWATAAAVSTSVQQGVLIARVHDVREMMDVIRVSDAIWS